MTTMQNCPTHTCDGCGISYDQTEYPENFRRIHISNRRILNVVNAEFDLCVGCIDDIKESLKPAPKCKICKGTGEIEYWHDAGDHFGGSPQSEYRTRTCESCEGTGKGKK